MHIEIQAKDFAFDEELAAYIQQQIDFGLHSRYNQVQKVRVRLSSMREANGGLWISCWIKFSVPPFRDIVVEYTAPNAHSAIDNALQRATRVLKRRLERQQSKKRKLFIPHLNKRVLVMTGNGL